MDDLQSELKGVEVHCKKYHDICSTYLDGCINPHLGYRPISWIDDDGNIHTYEETRQNCELYQIFEIEALKVSQNDK